MERVLLAVDAEGSAAKAVQEVIQEVRNGAEMELHLVNVQAAEAAMAEALVYVAPDAYYLHKGQEALAPAADALDAAGIPYKRHVLLGAAANAIVDYAAAWQVNRIILGRHHRGFLSGLLHGSVSAEVLRRSAIPLQVIPMTAAVAGGVAAECGA